METFELYLSPINEKQFRAIVTQSGETDSLLPFSEDRGDRRMTLLRSLEISGFNSQHFSSEEKDWMRNVGILAQNGNCFDNNYLVNIGQALYRSLFPLGKIEDAFKAALQIAQSKNTQLHVQLRFEDDSSKRSRLADYPWELLHDGQKFLLHHQVTFSRYIAHDSHPPNLPPVEKLNVLLISSAAFDKELGLQKLSKKEQQAIYKGLETASEAGHINLNELNYATVDELREYLTEHQGNNSPHVVHFDGHGIFGKRCKNKNCRAIHKKISATYCSKCNTELANAQGYLAFEGEAGKPDYVSAKELGALLQQTSFADNNQKSGGIALVVLSACQSAMTLEGESVFNGSAQNLINHRIRAVVAMQYSVRVDAATEFAKQFYRSLGQKNSLAVAINQGREAMGVEGNQWYRPVLYLRWQDNQGGQLFALPSTNTSPKAIPQNLPRSGVIKFVGREQTLENLHQQLQQTERVAISAVTGMGGIGKTELALQYGDRHWKQGTYSGGVCWLRVRDEDVGIQIINFAREIGLQPPDDFDLLNKVKYCWRNWQAGDVLVVFDDVREYEQIKDYLPPNEPRFKVLVTTRQQWLGQSFWRLILEVLEEKAALELLISFVGESRIYSEEEAKKLCADLGYLPLGLELVARYLQRKPNLSLVEMRRRLALEHRSLREASEDMTAQLGVKAAFELSWRELNEKAQELACLLSIFALAPIPWGLVEQFIVQEHKEYVEDIRDDLVNLSLLEDKGQNTYQLHQLIREFLIGKREELADIEDMKRRFCAVMAGAARNITETPTQLEIIEITPVIPHLIETASNLTNYLNYFDVIVPFARLGMLYKAKADYEQALQWCEQCLTICRKRFKEEHEEVATSLNNLAFLYCSQGRYQEAEPLYLQALQIRKKILGKEHLDVAISLNNLALFYRSQGLYEQAEPLCLQALQMRKRLLREEHPCIASSLDNLALIYRSQGRYKKAKPLFLQALQMRKRLLGESHPDVATSLNNLALLYSSQERYKRAEYLFLQALQMKKKLLGEEHLNIVAGLNNLALLYCSQERYPEAEPLFLQALQMVKKLLGESHPDVITSLNNLAALYNSQERCQEAETFYKQALNIAEQQLGVSHPQTMTVRGNYAACLKCMVIEKKYKA